MGHMTTPSVGGNMLEITIQTLNENNIGQDNCGGQPPYMTV